MEKLYEEAETGCCPRFNPEPWDEKEITFDERKFLKDRVTSIFHIPLNFGKLMTKNMEKIKSAGALPPEPFMLTDENSLWGADVYIEVSKEVPGAKMEQISGTFMSKVFEGPYKNAGKWAKDMEGYVESKGESLKKMYFFYTTCPKCAKYYGRNYTVLLAKIK